MNIVTTIAIDLPLRERLDAFAAETGASRSGVVRAILSVALPRETTKNPAQTLKEYRPCEK